MVRVDAFAKINLSLRVLGILPDGYHELRTIFQSIALHDTLTIRRARGPLRLACNDPACPIDRSNLVWRAATAMWRASGRRGAPNGVTIHIVKRIPIAAGLGGGSSDAAATLRALATMWRVDRERLPELAAALGADVPYFLEGGTVLGLGRGDVLYPLLDWPRVWVALLLPAFGVSTRDAYEWFDRDVPVGRRPPQAIARRELVNDLEPPVARRHPEIARIVLALRRVGASHASMTGSGSTVFGLFASRTAALRAIASLPDRVRAVSTTLVTRTTSRAECRRLAAK
jgi:4-diphosphocytidyl-2-C-methyl-D-erythritol kinase